MKGVWAALFFFQHPWIKMESYGIYRWMIFVRFCACYNHGGFLGIRIYSSCLD